MAYGQETADKEPLFTIKAPPGFEIDEVEQETIIDVLVNGKKVASTAVKFDDKTISFNDPDGLANLIPAVREHSIIADALRVPLDQNHDLACSQTDPKPQCGYMQPDIVGVIFSPDKLEAQIFISELYTYSRDSRARYLPPPTKGAGMIIGVNGRGFHDFNSDRTTLNSNVDLIAGYGRTHFRADMFATSQGGANMRGASLNYTRRTREASAGFLSYRNGSTLARSDRLAGVRIGSTLKTRLDQASLRAADIPILVTASARVETFRDGKLIDIQRVEPGQTTLDTTRFPGGSYEITIKITEDGNTREETRFFTSGSQLPPTGAPQWYVEAGLPTQNSSQGSFFPNLNKNPVVNAGYSKRMNSSLGLEGKLSASKSDQYAEGSVFFIGPNYSLTGGLIGSADGDYGGFANVNYRKAKWQVSGNYRDVRTADDIGIIVGGRYDPFPQSFRQVSLRTSYQLKNGRIGLRGFYRQTGTRADTYFGGPFVEYNMLKTKKNRLTLSANLETGNTRSSYFVGLRLNTTLKAPKPKQRLNLNAQTSFRSNTPKPDGMTRTREIAEAILRLTTSGAGGHSSEYFAGARYDDSDIGLKAGLKKRTSVGNLGLEVRHNYQRQSNLFADITTGLAIGPGNIAAFPQFNDSGVFVNIDGNSDTRFSVLSRGSGRQIASSSRTAFVPLNAFDLHDISIKPTEASDIDYENHADRLVLYPGNIPVVHRQANSVTILIGRVTKLNGDPVGFSAINTTKKLGVTDGDGFFQIDYVGDEYLDISKNGKALCKVNIAAAMTDLKSRQAFIDVGDITCE
ncbi:MAG TPA: hypothetical protein ENJ42_04985 [Hellea balneolensis]|uniref:Fimbrial biogenesis outer membrane usher protein n=1 Tax=Hellea balneolensis TaxID=287478 RepID=A0A7C5LZE8_9PROT|nr:hypothetical protein [Hellea balneolensis]